MRIRYTGSDDARDIALDGEFLAAERMTWVDVPLDVARSLLDQGGWEAEAPRKAAATRRRHASEADDSTVDEQPTVSEED